MNTSEALRASIALLYEKISREHGRPADVLARGPSFLAAGDSGDDRGSTDYKALLAQAQADKLS